MHHIKIVRSFRSWYTYITLEDADGVQEKEFVLCPIFTLLLFTHAICESPIVIFLWHQ